MKNLLVLALFTLIAIQVQAQFKFYANNCSEKYKAKIFVNNCAQTTCDGKATIILYDKVSDKELGTFHSADLDFNLTGKQDAKLGWLELSKYQSPLIFGDFNFDGLEDMAIRNGSNGIFMSPSYDIYLADDHKFTLNKSLTQLASENSGMFAVNKKSRELTVERKDGCCYYTTINYTVDAKNKITEASSLLEDLSIADYVTVITRKYVDGKVIKTVKKFKTKEYYKQ